MWLARSSSVAAALGVPIGQVLHDAREKGLGLRDMHVCSPSTTLRTLFELFAVSKVDVLVCVNEAGACVGMVTLKDLLSYFLDEDDDEEVQRAMTTASHRFSGDGLDSMDDLDVLEGIDGMGAGTAAAGVRDGSMGDGSMGDGSMGGVGGGGVGGEGGEGGGRGLDGQDGQGSDGASGASGDGGDGGDGDMDGIRLSMDGVDDIPADGGGGGSGGGGGRNVEPTGIAKALEGRA